MGKGVHCKNCEYAASWRAFQRLYQPPTPEEQAREKFVNDCHNILMQDADLLKYFEDRGISQDTVVALKFGFCDPLQLDEPNANDRSAKLAYENGGWVLENRITIPYIQDGIISQVRGREHPDVSTKKKYLSLPGSQGQPYLPSSIAADQPVVVCEGELDAALLRQNGIQAIGVPGSTSARVEWFSGYHNLYVTFDGDDAGEQGAEKLLKKLPEVRRVDLPEGYDVSEYVNNYGIDSFRILIEKSVLYLYGKPQRDDRFAQVVESFNDWAWTNGALMGPKMSWAPRMETTLSGWSPGLVLFGAEAHAGKSCWLVKSLYSLCLENPDAIGVYLSLDDTLNETMLRILSLHSGIDFNLIKSPRWNFDHPHDPSRRNPAQLAHYNDSVASLKLVDNLILRDATYGRSLRYLRTFFEGLRIKHADKKIVVFVDSLAKITKDGGGSDDDQAEVSNNWKAYCAAELKYMTTKYDICLVTPTDLRKLNGIRRPTRDDLKDAAELAYEAQVILLGYNDLKRARDRAVLHWENPDTGATEPVLEIIVDKNKFTGLSTTIRYKMLGSISEFWEHTDQEDKQADQAVKDQIDRLRKEAAGSRN